MLVSLAFLLPLVTTSLIHCLRTLNDDPDTEIEDAWNTTNILKNISVVNKELNLSFPLAEFFITEHEIAVNALKQGAVSSWTSSLFLFVILIGGLDQLFSRSTSSLTAVAVTTHTRKDKANYGSYMAWGQLGAGLTLFAAGVISSINHRICSVAVPAYFVAPLCSAVMMGLAIISVPWITYEYLDYRVINWAEVKAVVFDIHYIVMLFIGFYLGWCFSFQFNREYWYIAELSGSPVLMGIGGLVRRPFSAFWFSLSVQVIGKLGDLRTMAASLFIYPACQLTLFVIEIPWLVLVIDTFQSAAFAFSYSALNVHFSKAGSKASSASMIGLAEMTHAFGTGLGATCTGMLFNTFGTKTTLLSYSISTAIIFIFFLGYILRSKKVEDYELVRESDDDREKDDQ